jgi:hypothetical protein
MMMKRMINVVFPEDPETMDTIIFAFGVFLTFIPLAATFFKHNHALQVLVQRLFN